jgi:hypothetical protein
MELEISVIVEVLEESKSLSGTELEREVLSRTQSSPSVIKSALREAEFRGVIHCQRNKGNETYKL